MPWSRCFLFPFKHFVFSLKSFPTVILFHFLLRFALRIAHCSARRFSTHILINFKRRSRFYFVWHSVYRKRIAAEDAVLLINRTTWWNDWHNFASWLCWFVVFLLFCLFIGNDMRMSRESMRKYQRIEENKSRYAPLKTATPSFIVINVTFWHRSDAIHNRNSTTDFRMKWNLTFEFRYVFFFDWENTVIGVTSNDRRQFLSRLFWEREKCLLFLDRKWLPSNYTTANSKCQFNTTSDCGDAQKKTN